MRFAAPEYLWLLLATPLLVLASVWAYGRRRRALESFAGGRPYARRFEESVSRNRRAVKLLLLYGATLAIPVALARPQWGARLEPVTRHGSDVVIVLDTSLSMATEDLAPSRLDQAKQAIDTLLQRIEGDRVALVSFAGQATLNCPLTPDHAAVRLFLEALDVNAVSTPGTALAGALEVALRALRIEEADLGERGRAIVVFSDGEDHEGGLDEVIAEVDRYGVTVHAVGSGTARGGPIPLRDRNGILTGYKKDRNGQIVTTRVDEQVLERLALATGGRYYRATATGAEIDEIAGALDTLEAGELGAQLRTRYEERFQIPLAFGWLALLADTFLGDRRRLRSPRARADREAA